ncbi:MAG: extracellular solute-binding protein [Betaproteobacteria bacterium]|nr:MAG: extracellular solute-binding protein [Betaproteobacteria bacterium]
MGRGVRGPRHVGAAGRLDRQGTQVVHGQHPRHLPPEVAGHESGAVALFYNTEIFKNAGISGPPKTWDEYVAVARKVTNPEKKIFATTATLQGEPPTNMTYDIYPLILQAGGNLIDEKTNKAVFNSPEGVKAIEWYVDLANKEKVVVPGILSNGEKEKRANFAAGNVAMMFEGPWGIAIQKQLNPNLKYDIATLPMGVTTGTMVRGSLNTVTTQAQNKEAAWKFVRWLSGPTGIEMWSKGTGGFPARKDVADQAWFKEKTLFQAFAQQMQLPNARSPFLRRPDEQDHDHRSAERRAGKEGRQAGAGRRCRRVEQDPRDDQVARALPQPAARSARDSQQHPASVPTGGPAWFSRVHMAKALTFRRRYRQELQAYAFLWRALLILGLLMVYPLLQVIRMSFYEVSLQKETWVGLDNYAQLLQTSLFWQVLWQTIAFTAGSVALHLVIGLGLALLLHARINARVRNFMRGLLIIPWLLAPTVAGMIWVLMLAPFGVVNGLLASLGILDPSATINWLGSPETSLLSVTAMNVWRAFPFFMVMPGRAVRGCGHRRNHAAGEVLVHHAPGAARRDHDRRAARLHLDVPRLRPGVCDDRRRADQLLGSACDRDLFRCVPEAQIRLRLGRGDRHVPDPVCGECRLRAACGARNWLTGARHGGECGPGDAARIWPSTPFWWRRPSSCCSRWRGCLRCRCGPTSR